VLLTITTTRPPATELGYLLHKHPDRPQSFAISAGQAHVFYPEATRERCTAALLLEIDPITLVRGHKNGELAQYVNDRPYAAASMLAVAIKEAFRTALTGRCDARPGLAATPIPLEMHVPALRCRGGTTLADRVFAPLGWTVAVTTQPYAPEEWGDSPYLDLRLTGEARLADALNHLYVLLPVLDDAKHYWVSTEEVDKLIRAGGAWLAGHPEKELITRRYLSHQKKLTRSALARLAEADDTEPEELDNAVTDAAKARKADHLPVLAHLPRRAPGRPGRRRADGGHRARGPRTPAGPRACPLRHRRPRHRARHHAERRVQRALRDAPAGHAPAPGPPLRVDPRRVPRLGRASRRDP
jgi:3' terminal RNA ribose 2'-O-methyltransferase Hen1